VATGHVSWCVLLPHRHAGRLHWGKAESVQLCDLRMGQVTTHVEAQFCSSFQRCVHRHSCWSQANPARQYEAAQSVACCRLQTDGTILLSADMTVPYGVISFCACDCQRYMKCINTVVYFVHFKHKNMANLDSNFDGIDAILMKNSWHYFVQITWRAISNMGSLHITAVCLGSHSHEPWGDGDWDGLPHRRTQDFTVEGFHRR